jgi:ribosomal protein S18 acetylase RimI-like enzyme
LVRSLTRCQLFPVRYDEPFFASLLTEEMLAVVLEHEGAIVGVATGLLKHKATDWLGTGYGDNTLKVFYLATFGVAASHRRMGMGSRLLESFLALVMERAEPDCVVLHVKSLNEAGRLFYLARQFRVLRLKRSHYHIDGKPFDAYKMGLGVTEKSRAYLEAGPSLVDTLYKWLCCPLESDLIEDEKSK